MAGQQDARDKGLAFINTAKDKSLGFFSRRSMIDKLGLICVLLSIFALSLGLIGLLINGLGGFVDTLGTVGAFLNLTAVVCFSLGGPRRRKVMGIVFIVIVWIVGAIVTLIFGILRLIGAIIGAFGGDSKEGDSRRRDRSSTSDDDGGETPRQREARERREEQQERREAGAQHLWEQDRERQAKEREERRQRPGGRRR